MDIVEFLIARENEREQEAKNARSRFRSHRWTVGDGDVYEVMDLHSPHRCGQHPAGQPNSCDDLRVVSVDDDMIKRYESIAALIAHHDPAWVLADVAAKRAVMAMHPARIPSWPDECATCDDDRLAYERTRSEWPCPTLRALAQPYADHPDFDPAWRVELATT